MRRETFYALEAAVLIAADLFATPYIYFYDLPLLAVAFASLGWDAPFDRAEYSQLLFAGYIVWPSPGVFGAALLALTCGAGRILTAKHGTHPQLD